MRQSPSWEANMSSASQEIPCILWNQKFHGRIHRRPLTFPILSQINPVQNSPAQFWRYILILYSHLCLGLPSDLSPSGLPNKTSLKLMATKESLRKLMEIGSSVNGCQNILLTSGLMGSTKKRAGDKDVLFFSRGFKLPQLHNANSTWLKPEVGSLGEWCWQGQIKARGKNFVPIPNFTTKFPLGFA